MRRQDTILRVLDHMGSARSLLDRLESCGDSVWISKTCRCNRYNVIGIPARRLDVLVEEGLDDPLDVAVVVEVSRKEGRFDGGIRDRICIRRRHPGMDLPLGGVTVTDTDEGITISVGTSSGGWIASYDMLRAQAAPGGVRDIVGWHWSRYYRHLPAEVVDEVSEMIVLDGPVTITAANRLVSQALYAASRERGWRKMTLRERQKHGLPDDAGQWQRADEMAAIRMGQGHRSGCGQYTLDSARGAAMDSSRGAS